MTTDNAVEPAPQPKADWSGWEAWLRGHLDIFREEMLDGLAEAMVTVLKQERGDYICAETDVLQRMLLSTRSSTDHLRALNPVILGRAFAAQWR